MQWRRQLLKIFLCQGRAATGRSMRALPQVSGESQGHRDAIVFLALKDQDLRTYPWLLEAHM